MRGHRLLDAADIRSDAGVEDDRHDRAGGNRDLAIDRRCRGGRPRRSRHRFVSSTATETNGHKSESECESSHELRLRYRDVGLRTDRQLRTTTADQRLTTND